jgi:hypothetical protein
MRLTTKIILGIILSIFLLSLLHIIGYSFTDRKHYQRSLPDRTINIPQANKIGINIEPYQVIMLELEQSDSERRYFYNYTSIENGLFIHPAATADEENKLFLPDALKGFFSTQTSSDTLIIKIKMDEVKEKYGMIDETNMIVVRGISYGISFSGFNLYLHTTSVNVVNKLNNLQTRISNMETENIKIYSSGEITVDSCKATIIEPNSNRKVTVTNSISQALNLDLDRISNWDIENNCDIDVIYYTGSKRNHNISLRSDDRGKIVWQPKNDDAELLLRFKGDSARISYQIH